MPLVGQAPSNCPPGLEYLTQIDQLIVKQQIELFEGLKCSFLVVDLVINVIPYFAHENKYQYFFYKSNNCGSKRIQAMKVQTKYII